MMLWLKQWFGSTGRCLTLQSTRHITIQQHPKTINRSREDVRRRRSQRPSSLYSTALDICTPTPSRGGGRIYETVWPIVCVHGTVLSTDCTSAAEVHHVQEQVKAFRFTFNVFRLERIEFGTCTLPCTASEKPRFSSLGLLRTYEV